MKGAKFLQKPPNAAKRRQVDRETAESPGARTFPDYFGQA